MTRTPTKIAQAAKSWVAPQLCKLGKLADVAGSRFVNNNGINVNVQS